MAMGPRILDIESRLRGFRPPLSVELLDEIARVAWSKLNEEQIDPALDIALRLVAESILIDHAKPCDRLNLRVGSLVKAMNSMNQSATLQKDREFQDQKDKFETNIKAAYDGLD